MTGVQTCALPICECECGETDPNYTPPTEPEEPEHTHNFVDGECECGETDPNYTPPTEPEEPEHTHNFVEGECECGEKDPNYTPPTEPEEPEHTHNFVDGECECGEKDPNYIPPAPVPTVPADYIVKYFSAYDDSPLVLTYANGRLASESCVLVSTGGGAIINYTFTYEYNASGELVKVIMKGVATNGFMPLFNETVEFVANDDGLFVSEQDALTLTITLYDNGAVKSRNIFLQDGIDWTTEYDESGRLVKDTDENTVVTYAYADDDDTVANEITYTRGADVVTIVPTFGEDGIEQITVSGVEYEYTYNSDNKLVKFVKTTQSYEFSVDLEYVESGFRVKRMSRIGYIGEKVDATENIEYTYEDDTIIAVGVGTKYTDGVATEYSYYRYVYELVDGEWTDVTPEVEEYEVELSETKSCEYVLVDGELSEVYVIEKIEFNDAGEVTKYTKTEYIVENAAVDLGVTGTVEVYTVTYDDNNRPETIECVSGDWKYVITFEYDAEGALIKETQKAFCNEILSAEAVIEYNGEKIATIYTALYTEGVLQHASFVEYDENGNIVKDTETTFSGENITGKVVTEYNGDRVVKVSSEVYSEGALQYTIVTEYGENGNASFKYYDADGNLILKPDLPFVDIENGEIKIPTVPENGEDQNPTDPQ